MVRLGVLVLLGVLAAPSGLLLQPGIAAQERARADDVDDDYWWRTLLGNDDAFPEHRQRVLDDWRKHGSYYALLEIVDARIEPALGKIRMEQVIDLLGTRRVDLDYPNARRDNFLVWSSNRLIPQGSYLIVRFSSDGVAQSIDWVSE